MARKPGLALAGLHLFTLSSYAVAQPVLDLISKNLQFLVAHKLTPVEIFLLLGFLILAVPLPFLLLSLAARLLDRRSGFWWLQGLSVCLLTSAFLLQVCKSVWEGPGALLVATALAAGLIFSIGYIRLPLMRQFVTWLTPGLLFFPVWFLFGTPVLEVATVNRALTVPRLGSPSTTPILMVVFDQLPLVSLLDEEGQIDPIRYPNFSELAQDSVWYRNATAVSDRTGWALPALLPKSYPYTNITPPTSSHSSASRIRSTVSNRSRDSVPPSCVLAWTNHRALAWPCCRRIWGFCTSTSCCHRTWLNPCPQLTRAGKTWPKELPKPGRTSGSSGETATV